MNLKTIFGVVLLVSAVAVLGIVCSEDKAADPIAFTFPNDYRGTYFVIQHWLGDDADTLSDSVTFEFRGKGVFYMEPDAVYDTARNFCTVIGTYYFHRDTLIVDIDNNNYLEDICVDEFFPTDTSIFDHYIDQGFIVFEIRDTALYRKIEIRP